jgi:hypothetical protein
MVLTFSKVHSGETDRPIPLWDAITIGTTAGCVSALTGVGWWDFSCAYSHRATLGAETNSSPFSLLCIGKSIVLLAAALCGAVADPPDLVLFATSPTIRRVAYAGQEERQSSGNRRGNLRRHRETSCRGFPRTGDRLLAKVSQRVDDADVVHLLKIMLKASGKRSVPQGGVISPRSR